MQVVNITKMGRIKERLYHMGIKLPYPVTIGSFLTFALTTPAWWYLLVTIGVTVNLWTAMLVYASPPILLAWLLNHPTLFGDRSFFAWAWVYWRFSRRKRVWLGRIATTRTKPVRWGVEPADVSYEWFGTPIMENKT